MSESQLESEDDRPAPTAVIHRPQRAGQGPALGPKQRLVEAGWKVLDELPLAKVLAGATSSTVAAAAGVTTGSFFHHFARASEFADAMALAFVEPPDLDHRATEPPTDDPGSVDLLGDMKSTLRVIWDNATQNEDLRRRFRAQMRLWSHNHLPLSNPSEEFVSIADVLVQGYRIREGKASEAWAEALRKSGREILDPFDFPMLSTVITCLFEGLLIRHAVDPETIGPEMFGNVAAAITDRVTGPAGSRVEVSPSAIQLSGPGLQSPQARSGARRRHETRSRIVERATGMFKPGWEQVSSSEIADRAGFSSQTVLNLFGTVRGVAAATFSPHARDLYSFAIAHPELEPLDGLTETLHALIMRIRIDPEAARALLAERIATRLQRGASLGDMDVRLEVPLAGALALWISRMGLAGDEGMSVATMLSDFVLTTSLGSDREPAEIVELAVRLIPPELSNSGTPVDG